MASEILNIYYDKDNDYINKADYIKGKYVLIGIADAIGAGNLYTKGYRNNMAVDWCIACKVCGIKDPIEASELLELSSDERKDFEDRVWTVSGYTNQWESTGHIWDFAMMTDDWTDWYDNTNVHHLVVHHLVSTEQND